MERIARAGDRRHQEVRDAESKTIEMALKKGLHPRIEIGEPAQAEPYLAMGVNHFCIGWDVGILANFWSSRGETMRGLQGVKTDTAKAADTYR